MIDPLKTSIAGVSPMRPKKLTPGGKQRLSPVISIRVGETMTRAGDETKRAGAAAGAGEGGATGVEARLLEILPVATVEALAGVLTEDDADTLRHLFRKSLPDNTLRAIASDLGYLEAWARAAHLAGAGGNRLDVHRPSSV
jgi:hypothetical protein